MVAPGRRASIHYCYAKKIELSSGTHSVAEVCEKLAGHQLLHFYVTKPGLHC